MQIQEGDFSDDSGRGHRPVMWRWVIFMGILSFNRYSISIVKKRRAGEVCLDYLQKCSLDG